MSHERSLNIRTRTVLIGGGAILSVVIIVSITALTASGATPSAAPKLPAAFSNPNFPLPTDAHPEPTKAALVHRDATARIDAATQFARDPPTKDPNTPTPIPISNHPASKTGIIAGPLSREDDLPFRNDMVIENFYRAFPNNFMFVVVAGVAIGDPQQGFVGVGSTMHPMVHSSGLVALNESPTPTKHGSVHITAVNGSLVTLVATDGTTFIFDDSTYTFK